MRWLRAATTGLAGLGAICGAWPTWMLADEPAATRPRAAAMLEGGSRQPPPPRDLVVARRTLRQRFGKTLFRADSHAGARQAADRLFEAAVTETDRPLKWLLLDEARRLGMQAGDAATIDEAVTLAAASYDFDAIELEIESLARVPLRALDRSRAGELAEVAERLATRAEADGRLGLAVDAQMLAVRGWQRAGNREATRRAAIRHDQLDHARVTASP